MQPAFHKHKSKILLALVILSLIAAPIFEVAALLAAPPVTTTEQSVFSEEVSMTVANGTMISSFGNDFQNVAEGLYNISLPYAAYKEQVELNESVSSIKLAVSYHMEFPGINTQRAVITDGYQWTISNQYSFLRYSSKRQTVSISGGISSSETYLETYTLNKNTTAQFNNSDIGIDCEFILGVISTSDGTTPSAVQNSTVLFSIGLSLSLLCEKTAIPSNWTAVFISTLILSIIGISALVVFVKKPLPMG
jgi:hypothetical protein